MECEWLHLLATLPENPDVTQAFKVMSPIVTNLQKRVQALRQRVQSCRNVLLNHARQNPTDTTCKLEAEACLADLEATRG